MTQPTMVRPLVIALAMLAAGAALAASLTRPAVVTGEAADPPVLVGGSGLDGVVPGSAFGAAGDFGWLSGHLTRYHDPLKLYP